MNSSNKPWSGSSVRDEERQRLAIERWKAGNKREASTGPSTLGATIMPCRMSHRHYEFLATVLQSVPESLALDSADDRLALARHFAKELARTNPRFDSVRFIEAATSPLSR